MRLKPWKTGWAAGLLAALLPAAQALEVGGLSLSEAGFADTLLAASGSYTTSAGSLAQALTDHSLSTWAQSGSPGAYVVLGFTDHLVVNGVGNDIVLFERGHEAYEYSQEGFDSFNITINGHTRTYFTTETTTIVDDHNVNMTSLDLSFFGIAEGATVDRIQIGMDFATRDSLPQLMLVAAIHSVAAPVPEPAAWALWLAGAGGLVAWRRRVAGGASA